jgi:Icc-related predicted phosphoesterase
MWCSRCGHGAPARSTIAKMRVYMESQKKIALLGDIHGEAWVLDSFVAKAVNSVACFIQVGDFGVYPTRLRYLIEAAQKSQVPIYFIDGNHEHFPIIMNWWKEMDASGAVTHEVVPGKLIYVRRGAVLELGGRKIGFLGGAGSIDYAYRKLGESWFHEEQIADSDVERLLANAKDGVDLLVTHCPPQDTITRLFDINPEIAARTRRGFGARPDWYDPSAHKVEYAWTKLGRPPLYCGHMHRTVEDGAVRILNINEVVIV